MKLCPRLHLNPRYAACCSQCGSRDLSTPQPRVPLWWKAFGFLLKVSLGVLFVYLGLALLAPLAQGLLTSDRAQSILLVFGFLFISLLWLWHAIPEWLKKLLRKGFGRKGRGDGR